MCVCVCVCVTGTATTHLNLYRYFVQPSALHANSTRCYMAVTHLSTNHAQVCLTAVN